MKMICENCMDFDAEKKECTIRFKISRNNEKTPMKRRPKQKGCQVFMMK